MHGSKRLSLLHAPLRVASISDYLFLVGLVRPAECPWTEARRPCRKAIPSLLKSKRIQSGSICFSFRYESLNSPPCRVKQHNLLPSYLDSRPRGRKRRDCQANLTCLNIPKTFLEPKHTDLSIYGDPRSTSSPFPLADKNCQVHLNPQSASNCVDHTRTIVHAAGRLRTRNKCLLQSYQSTDEPRHLKRNIISAPDPYDRQGQLQLHGQDPARKHLQHPALHPQASSRVLAPALLC